MNKIQGYEQLLKQLEALLEGDHDLISRMANTSSLLYQNLDHINWAGFYRLVDGMLILGPFQGKPACTPIPLGKGVCGTCAATQELVCVDNVHAFPGHIACDSASNSEIVLPLMIKNTLIGVLDIDSNVYSRFDQCDCSFLSLLINVMLNDDVLQSKL